MKRVVPVSIAAGFLLISACSSAPSSTSPADSANSPQATPTQTASRSEDPKLSTLASRDDALKRLSEAGLPCTVGDVDFDTAAADSQDLDGWLTCTAEEYVVLIGGFLSDPASTASFFCELDNPNKQAPIGGNWYVRTLDGGSPSNENIATALEGTVKTHTEICNGTQTTSDDSTPETESAEGTASVTDGYCLSPDECPIGSIGPGGGIVFYDAGTRKPWGRFLEVAQPGWNVCSPRGECDINDPDAPWCLGQNASKELRTRKKIGSGASNTDKMWQSCGDKSTAIGLTAVDLTLGNARYGGDWLEDAPASPYQDESGDVPDTPWHIPSQGELRELMRQDLPAAQLNRDSGCYWTSSQASDLPDAAMFWDFRDGRFYPTSKSFNCFVRPVRAF